MAGAGRRPTAPVRSADLVAGLVGGALGAASGVVATVRPQGRSLHPRGAVLGGVLRRWGAGPRTGSPWLDVDGEDRVLVRVSRSLGLPRPLPDVAGLAVRIPLEGDRHADLLLSSAGTGPVGRHLLRPTRGRGRLLTTLLPLRSPTGPVLLGVAADGAPGAAGAGWTVRACRPGRPWWDVGRLDLDADPATRADQPVRFDAIRNPLPQLAFDPWVGRLRAPAYDAARAVGRVRTG